MRTSPVLFNSIMFAICKFYRPELVESMLDLAETAIFRCMRVAYYDVPLVQGILTLVYWKRPGDRTSYIKVCLARRCLQQLGLRLDFSLPNTAKPIMEERARVDVIRTVLSEYALMTTLTELDANSPYSDLSPLTRQSSSPHIRPSSDCHTWETSSQAHRR